MNDEYVKLTSSSIWMACLSFAIRGAQTPPVAQQQDREQAVQHPAISHVEQLLAASYYREIDHEDGIWRSLPFFAATLALENAALFQILTRLPPAGTVPGKLSAILLTIIGLTMIVALVLLTRCFAPTRFRYIAEESGWLRYAGELIAAERETAGTDTPVHAAGELSLTLARQYAAAIAHNRRVNQRRDLLRAQATLAVACSVLLIMLLIGVDIVYQLVTA